MSRQLTSHRLIIGLCTVILFLMNFNLVHAVDHQAVVRIHRFDEPVVKISSGVFHTLAVKKSGKVEIWGSNEEGTLNVPKDLDEVVDVAAGRCFSVALKKDGTVVAWGDDKNGQCQPPPGLSDVVAIAAGYQHVLALKKDGTIVTWGGNKNGQLLIPKNLGRIKAISACFYQSFAVKEDGKVVGWGYYLDGQTKTPRYVKNVMAVSSGSSFTLALKEDGKLVGWGNDEMGQISPPADLSDVIGISATSRHHALALKSNGKVAAWGSNGFGQTNVPADLQDVIAVSVGWYHSTALKRDGVVYEWGRNNHGPGAAFVCYCKPPPPETEEQKKTRWVKVFPGLSIKSISAGATHSLAVKKNGTVVAWGNNSYGQCRVPAGLTNVVATAGGTFHSLALKGDGSVVAWGRNHECQTDVPADLGDVIKIFAGDDYSAAIKRDGRLIVWGSEAMTQFAATLDHDSISELAAAKNAIYVKTTNNEIRFAGVPDTKFKFKPEDLVPVADVEKLWAGNLFVIAQTKSGAFRLASPWWQMAPPNSLPADLVDIQCGYAHCLALKNDGTVVAWGGNRDHQCVIPPGLSNVTMVAAGERHSLSLSSDGTLACWGQYENGQLNAPVELLKEEEDTLPLADMKRNDLSQEVIASANAIPPKPKTQPALRQITSKLPASVNFGNVGTASVSYAGLIRPDEVTPSSVATEGFLNGVLSHTGVFSGRLWLAGKVQAFVASFGNDGRALFGKKHALDLADGILTLALQKDGILIKIVRGTEFSSGLAVQGVYDKKHLVPDYLVSPAAREGMTLNIPPASSLPGYLVRSRAEQEGRASLHISRNGHVFLFGSMGDGSPLSTSSILTPGNQVPLYVPLMSINGQASAFSGTLNIDLRQDDENEEKGHLWYRQPSVAPVLPINP